jgi:hypothetical protein
MKIRPGRACLDDATPCHCRREDKRHQSSHVTIKPRHLIQGSVNRSNDSVREAHCYMTRQCGVARLVGGEHGIRGECRPKRSESLTAISWTRRLRFASHVSGDKSVSVIGSRGALVIDPVPAIVEAGVRRLELQPSVSNAES